MPAASSGPTSPRPGVTRAPCYSPCQLLHAAGKALQSRHAPPRTWLAAGRPPPATELASPISEQQHAEIQCGGVRRCGRDTDLGLRGVAPLYAGWEQSRGRRVAGSGCPLSSWWWAPRCRDDPKRPRHDIFLRSALPPTQNRCCVFLLCGRLFFHRASPILGMGLPMTILLETVTHFGYGSCYAYSVGDSLTAAGTLGESDLSQYRTTGT
jgi:hypothetical protein